MNVRLLGNHGGQTMLGLFLFIFAATLGHAQTTATTPLRIGKGRPIQMNGITSASATRRNPMMSGRPLLAVGILKSFDAATSSVTVAIDRERSSLPHALAATASKARGVDKLIEQEFPAERTFHLARFTRLYDARTDQGKPQTLASTGRMRHDKQLLKPSDFQPGDTVSVFFRMNPQPGQEPFVLNVSKLDPNATGLRADVGPAPIQRQRQAPVKINAPTTASAVTASPKTTKTPAGAH